MDYVLLPLCLRGRRKLLTKSKFAVLNLHNKFVVLYDRLLVARRTSKRTQTIWMLDARLRDTDNHR